ncbi:UNVERIFIED_CONTAM: hypothetical protein Sradi_6929700 [Sesamum radiatum]|uniref:GAG-pre-integrase domain-containing protein n=1 Tax=Sesamum radiatum TaxID=300843 RepID=A0AAW2JH53_SESRA
METNKFNGSNYTDWLRNLKIVLDFENQGYVLDKPLFATLPEGSSPEEHLTFEKWHEYNRKATNHKSEPAVLVGETSTSKAKGKGARRWKRNKDKGTTVTATASTGGAPPAASKGKGKGKVGGSQRSKANDVCMHCQGNVDWKRECPQLLSNLGMLVVEINMISNSASWVLDTNYGAHICNNLQVLETSRKLSKDEMILRLGNGKAVAAEAVGSLSHKRKVDNHENARIWHARLGHSSKDRIRRLVNSKNLKINDLDHLPTCESCLKGKMTKKPFVGQSAIANGLLDLVHIDICGPLSIPARGGFSYFITFTDDHSRYGYVYLMSYQSEAFGRFKEYRLEVENQTNR